MELQQLGKWLLGVAAVLALAGVLLIALGGRPPLGRLPGDISYRRGNTRVYVPLATSLLVSVVVTIVLNLLLRRGR